MTLQIITNVLRYGAHTPISPNLHEMIDAAGLLTSLVLCLDPAAIESVPSTDAQTWLDMTGGTNRNFYRGNSSHVDPSSDPVLIGVPGSLRGNTYWQFDGGDFFKESTTNMNFADSWEKDAAHFSFAAMVYIAGDAFGAATVFANCANSSSDAGVNLVINSTGLAIFVMNKKTAYTYLANGTIAPRSSAWNFVGWTVDEASHSGRLRVNNAYDAITPTYTNPGNFISSLPYTLAARPDGANYFPNNWRLGPVCAWNRALSGGEIESLYASLQARYPSLP